MSSTLSDAEVKYALATVENCNAGLEEKIDMLVQIAMRLQVRPQSVKQLHQAVDLYNRALELSIESEKITVARLKARKATALHVIPEDGYRYLQEARKELEEALVVLEEEGNTEEVAEAYLNLGLIYQALSSCNQAKIADCIVQYQKSLRVFNKDKFPVEFAIIHNNLATAYLSIPMSDEKATMREALAVQSYKSALEVVTLEDNPNEYAMLQNNLGNALQYASTSHALDNNLRALQAYDEALKVRDKRNSPVSYANTIANKANCLCNLPDDPDNPQIGNARRMTEAKLLYKEAAEIFNAFGETEKARTIELMLSELDVITHSIPQSSSNGPTLK